MKCDTCNNVAKCLDRVNIPGLLGCTSGIPSHKIPTNADKLRHMSDEELAEFLAEHDLWLGDDILPMPDDWLNWLQSPADVTSEAEEISVRS